MDVDLLLEELNKVEQALKCGVCHEKCINPVRIKVCGHYFCLKCHKLINARFCPVCNQYYEERNVDYNNIAKETTNILADLKACLLNANSADSLKTTPFPTDQLKKEYIFEYNKKLYRMNYVDELYTKINAKGETPLHTASKRKDVEQVVQLIEKKVDLNVEDFAGWAPLHEAVESGSIEIVELLLKHGALVDIPGPEYITPLHKAVTLENEYLVRMLLEYGANKETLDYFGKKPLEYTQNVEIGNIFLEDIICTKRVENIFCGKKIYAYFYYTEDSYKDRLIKSNLVKTVTEFNPKKITHFIMKTSHKLSLKILVAMLEGRFLVPQEWIDNFLNNDYFVPIPEYTFIHNEALNKGIKEALLNSLLKLPKLFDGIFFYIQGHNRPVEIHKVKFTKESVASIITAGGGKILHRAPTPTISEDITNFPYHSNRKGRIVRCCHYIIYEKNNPPKLQYQMAEIKHKSSEWLIECVINFTIYD